MDPTALWQRLPQELRERPQWVLAGLDKVPLRIDADGKQSAASVTSPGDWMDFQSAEFYARERGLNIGYVLSEDDPFTCIDMDVKDATTHPENPELWSTIDDFQRYTAIMQTFDSYTERSRSGKGLHVWVRGNIGKGHRRDGVEVYSQDRYMICTGDVIHGEGSIKHQETLLLNMVSRMIPQDDGFELEELPERDDDWYILQMGFGASNGEKFSALWFGKWQEQGFPSQSEADLAFMSMLTFYSDSNEQCRRLFRESGLGKREKAQRNNKYLNRTLTTIRKREAQDRLADISAIVQSAQTRAQLAQQEIARLQGGAQPTHALDRPFGQQPSIQLESLHSPTQAEITESPPPKSVGMLSLAPESEAVVQQGQEGIPWPPGMVGAVAQYIYQSAGRPVKEVAIVSALGLMAGICGKAWYIPRSGLNLYIVLVALSGIGKESLHQGVADIIKAVSKKQPSFANFVSFDEFASGQALLKEVLSNPSFVHMNGEWGRTLQRLSNESRDTNAQAIRTQMTKLYQRSGPQAIVGGINYSSSDNNIKSVSGVNYSMVGETTPNTFFEALTREMMEDGFLSRFIIIEYDGPRVPQTDTALQEPPTALTQVVGDLCAKAQELILKQQSQLVGATNEARELVRQFEVKADAMINEHPDDESVRHPWNRAGLKALRVAALLAVGDNMNNPTITEQHIRWAIDLVERDVKLMGGKHARGEIGLGDDAREKKMVEAFREYLTRKTLPKYVSNQLPMRDNGIVGSTYLNRRLGNVSAFRKHPRGANSAITETLVSLMSQGYLKKVDPSALVRDYNFHGTAYRILTLPDYEG